MDVNVTLLGAYLGAAFAVGLGAIGSAVGVGMIGSSAVKELSRQPGVANELLKTMLIGQAITESTGIFALLVSLMLLFQGGASSWVNFSALVAAGFSIGLGAMGSGLGSGLPGIAACRGVSRQPQNEGLMMVNMLIAQAVTQTPVIFSLVVSFLLIFHSGADSLVRSFALIGAGLSMGFGAIGPGLGSGIAGQSAIDMMSRFKKEKPVLLRMMLLGQSVAQSTAIYAMVVAFILIFVA